jgi:hypothetical protein
MNNRRIGMLIAGVILGMAFCFALNLLAKMWISAYDKSVESKNAGQPAFVLRDAPIVLLRDDQGKLIADLETLQFAADGRFLLTGKSEEVWFGQTTRICRTAIEYARNSYFLYADLSVGSCKPY